MRSGKSAKEWSRLVRVAEKVVFRPSGGVGQRNHQSFMLVAVFGVDVKVNAFRVMIRSFLLFNLANCFPKGNSLLFLARAMPFLRISNYPA